MSTIGQSPTKSPDTRSLTAIRRNAELLARKIGIENLRAQFPILDIQVRGKPLVYLDNSATTQKPKAVIDAINRYYTRENANVHRGIHYLSEKATDKFEEVRTKVAKFLGAKVDCEIIFTRGTTESINLVAQSYALPRLRPGDVVLVTLMEHHSNFVPWQQVCLRTGATLKILPITEDGRLDIEQIDKYLTEKTKIFAVTHISNVLGTINPIKELTRLAHEVGAVVVIDGAQSSAHLHVDVQEVDCDFFACSGHKMYGPTGIGILYGKAYLLEQMEPYQFGGNMIMNVQADHTTFAYPPQKFEAGTPHIEGVIGLGYAIDFIQSIGLEMITKYEHALSEYVYAKLSAIPGIQILGPTTDRASVFSFTMDCAHPHDIGQILDGEGIAIRAGQHCAQPIMDFYRIPGTARASFAIYNTVDEVDTLERAIYKVKEIFE